MILEQLLERRPAAAEARVALIRPETDAAWRTLRKVAVEARRIRVTGCSALATKYSGTSAVRRPTSENNARTR